MNKEAQTFKTVALLPSRVHLSPMKNGNIKILKYLHKPKGKPVDRQMM